MRSGVRWNNQLGRIPARTGQYHDPKGGLREYAEPYEPTESIRATAKYPAESGTDRGTDTSANSSTDGATAAKNGSYDATDTPSNDRACRDTTPTWNETPCKDIHSPEWGPG